MNNYRITVVDSLSQWETLCESWNKLLLESSSYSIFLSWEWLFSWGECFLNKTRIPFILTAYDKDELVGIAPWCINYVHSGPFRLRRVEFLGTPESGSDYLDVITKKNSEKEISLCLYNFLFNESQTKWDCLSFREVPSNSFFFLNFLNEFDKYGKYVEIEKGSFCPVVTLPKTKEDYTVSLSRNRRQQFKKHFRKLEREGNVQHLTTMNVEDNTLLNIFSALYEKRWGTIDKKYLMFLRNFICRAKEKEYVRFDLLKVDDQPIAITMHLVFKGILYNYLTIVDRKFRNDISVGNIINELSIENAIDDKFNQYDFLKGDEEYKFHWANYANRSLNIRYYQRRVGALGYFMVEGLRKVGKIVLR